MNAIVVDKQPVSQPTTANHLSDSMLSEPTPVLIDVRTPGEFESVHIPEARNIPLPELHKYVEKLKVISSEHPLLLICRTHNRVKIAYEYLTKNGIDNCRILEGGMTDWEKGGKPLIRGRRSISLEGQVRAFAGSLVVVGVVLGFSVHAWFLYLPLFVGLGLIHAGLTDSCLMGMVLSKLPMNKKAFNSSL